MDIKKLRFQALNLITKNIKNIDGRQVAKLQKIALNSKKPKLEELINQLNDKLNEVKNEIVVNNRKKNLKTTIVKPKNNKLSKSKKQVKKNKYSFDDEVNNNDQKIDLNNNDHDDDEYKEEEEEEKDNKQNEEKMIDLYIVADVNIEYINTTGKPFDKKTEVKMAISIPENKKNDEN